MKERRPRGSVGKANGNAPVEIDYPHALTKKKLIFW